MSIANKVHPFNKNHSIKEAVISLFLANPIIKPERFKNLIETDLINTFHKFETVNQVQFEFQNNLGVSQIVNQQLLPNVGFKFLSFEKGENVRVLQGMNEKARNFISYHALNYTRWKEYYNDYLKVINSISRFHPDFFVTAFSLHYIDHFLWMDKNPIELNLIFNNNGNYIPKEFFKSSLSVYSIISEKYIHGVKYIDRLEIKVESIIQPSITISHNVTRPLDDVVLLNDLIIGNQFSEILDSCHMHNKEILFDILTPEIISLINLNAKQND